MNILVGSIRKLIAVICALSLLVFSCSEAAASGLTPVIDDGGEDKQPTAQEELPVPDVPRGSAIVMDAKSGAVLFEKNAYEKRAMASTTKIMTALIALEQGDIGREIVIDADMLAHDEPGSTKLGLVLGDHITMYDLLVGMMLISGNDCAQSVAVAVAGSYDDFASLMNEKASQLGMLDTHFITPSGLDDENHFSTAYDMALLGIEAMKNEDFASIVKMKSATIFYGNPMVAHIVASHNYLLEGMGYGVKGCDGIKTGHTWNANYCLVSHCVRDGVELVCVTLGVPTYWSYQAELYEYAFSKYTKVSADSHLDKDTMMVIGGAKQAAKLVCDTGDTISVPRDQVEDIRYEIDVVPYEYAPISKGQLVGWKRYYYGTLMVAEFPIYADENIDCVTNDWLSAYIDAIKYNMSGSG